MAKSTCGGCGEVFKSAGGFDKHRVGGWGDAIYKSADKKSAIGYTAHSRRCMTPDEMVAAGMLKNAQGWWIMSAYDTSAHADDNEEIAAD